MVQYFYIKYLNEKFAHLPVDPVYEFVELTENYNLNLVFKIKDYDQLNIWFNTFT